MPPSWCSTNTKAFSAATSRCMKIYCESLRETSLSEVARYNSIRSERLLMEELDYNILYRWLLDWSFCRRIRARAVHEGGERCSRVCVPPHGRDSSGEAVDVALNVDRMHLREFK